MSEELNHWRESLRRYGSDDGRYGNELTLDCGHTIFADPNWNEVALNCAIQEHYKKHE